MQAWPYSTPSGPSDADITIYIDGVAASMASVIALCGKPVYMSQYARLMLHNPYGGCYGNKEEMKAVAEQLEALEDTLADMYASKTGKTREEIKDAYFDGKDHWITAKEAREMGFIDGIYDIDEKVDAGDAAGSLCRHSRPGWAIKH